MITAVENSDVERTSLEPTANPALQRAAVLVSHLPTDLQKEFASLSMRKVECLGTTKERLDRIEVLLKKDKKYRTSDERIELFNLLLIEGREKAQKAKDKDIVLFMGDTDAGKSTLINYSYGCKLIKNAQKKIVVDPKSPIPEAAKIGTAIKSCTALPHPIPDLSIKSGNQETVVTLFDMPGFRDNRGIEVALANAILAKEIMSLAKTVRCVVVFDKFLLFALRGENWEANVKVIEEKFSNTLGRCKNSISLVITKDSSPEALPDSQNEIKIHAQTNHHVDLSSYAITYDPLHSHDREKLLQTLFDLHAHKGLSNQISLSKEELWDAVELGKDMAEKVAKDLETKQYDEAVKKARFTHGISILGNQDLILPHKAVLEAINIHIKKLLEDIDPTKDIDFKTRLEALKKYNLIKSKFQSFVDFEETDKEVRKLIHQLKDPRDWYGFHTPYPTFAGSALTAAFGIWIHPYAAVPPGIGTGCCAYAWLKPSKEDQEMTNFFKKPEAVLSST